MSAWNLPKVFIVNNMDKTKESSEREDEIKSWNPLSIAIYEKKKLYNHKFFYDFYNVRKLF